MLGRPSRLAIAALVIGACASAFAQSAGILTVAEGGVVLVRGTTTYTAAQGVTLHGGDMLALAPKGQAQIEFEDGALLNLAGGSRAWLLGPQGAGGEVWVALQPGWAKFGWAKASKGRPYRYIMPLARLSASRATGVLRTGEDSSEIFIESGAARLEELSKAGAPGSSRDLKGGEFALRRPAAALAVSPRPSADFIKAMPGYFRDDLPVLVARARNKGTEPKREREATYADVEPWLKASVSIRRHLVERFRSRAKDPQFRGKLIENLPAHPEWDRVLFPEKYERGAEKEEKSESK